MPSLNGNPVVDSSLIFCADILNPRSYPGSGSTWTDLIKGATVTLQSGAAYAAGAIALDGTINGYISGSVPSGLVQGGTREFLVYVTDLATQQEV